MKYKNRYLFFIAACFAVLYGCQSGKNKLPDLKETYSKADKKPFGAYIAYNQLQEMYYTNTIRQKRQSFSATWNEIADKEALYMLVSKNLYLTSDEVDDMLQFVKRGNDMFISSANIDKNLTYRLKILQYGTEDREDFYIDYNRMKKTSTNFEITPYPYYYLPFNNYFSGFEKNQYIKPIAVNDNGKTNCLVYFYGKGKLFLHAEPRAFSNYFLLQKNNYQYMENILAYTNSKPEHVYWDDYYRTLRTRKADDNNNDRDGGFSTFGEIMKHPALKAAFWLSLLMLLLYILFGGKRRQRIIEPIKPNVNTTVAFTETIGRLYLQKKDNRNIAEKMCTYFNEYVRNNYFLNTNVINDEFLTTLSRKSGIEKSKVETLYRAMAQAQNKYEVSDFELLHLNEQIQQFYKK